MVLTAREALAVAVWEVRRITTALGESTSGLRPLLLGAVVAALIVVQMHNG